jgi:hypothetical protein
LILHLSRTWTPAIKFLSNFITGNPLSDAAGCHSVETLVFYDTGITFMRLLTACNILACLAASLFAQNETAVLTGRVLDPAGLGVAHARIRLTETSSGAERTSLSVDGGFYRFDLLPPGDYAIQATADGFKKYGNSSLHLDVSRSSTLDIQLTLGAVAESVEVNAEVSPLVTASAAQGTVISSDKLLAIPLNGRQFLQLALLSPAANSGGLAVQHRCARAKLPA